MNPPAMEMRTPGIGDGPAGNPKATKASGRPAPKQRMLATRLARPGGRRQASPSRFPI